jgi:hypothetical protein
MLLSDILFAQYSAEFFSNEMVPQNPAEPAQVEASAIPHGVKFLGVEGVSPSDFEDRL